MAAIKKRIKNKGNMAVWGRTLLLILLALTIVFPLYMTVIIAFKQPTEMTNIKSFEKRRCIFFSGYVFTESIVRRYGRVCKNLKRRRNFRSSLHRKSGKEARLYSGICNNTMDDQRDGNYLWEKIGHSQEIVIKYKKLVNRLKEASVCCKRGGKSSLIKLEIARKEKSMLTILNSESLWIGTDMIQFNAIRDILDREKIKYKYKTYNHLGEWAGSGTLRGNFGSVGNPTSQSIQYEIFVARKDLEKAQAVMWNLLR